MFQSQNPALVIIDVQQAIDHFDMLERSHPDAERALAQLLAHWRDKGWPVIHIRHSSVHRQSPYHASSPWYDFKTEVMPIEGESVVTKQENCAFIDTELEALLHQEKITELVVGGVLLNHSVDATVRIAKALKFRVLLIEEACPASSLVLENQQVITAEQVHQIMLNNLRGEYAELVPLMQLIS
ncbi:MAG: isochorismatase family protein [Cellvibrionaceae bacterium]